VKFSELQGITREEWGLPYPRSSLADPPISGKEARTAVTANCPKHHGLIATQPTQDDAEGRVYLCGVGNQYWRYTRKRGIGRLSPLKYNWRRVPC
jgi:hypothetical protein